MPLLAVVVEQLGLRLAATIGRYFNLVPRYSISAAEAGGAMDTIANLTIAVIVFTFGSMLVALQVAGAQMTPWIIATTLLRDNI